MTVAIASTPADPSPALVRGAFLGVVALALTAGFLATDPTASAEAIGRAGPELTRLLRAMAVIKVLFAGAALAAVAWRLAAPVSPVRFAAYALAAAATAAGPGLIWGMAQVGLGALLLHAGIAASVVLVWRDPATAARFARLSARRAVRSGPR